MAFSRSKASDFVAKYSELGDEKQHSHDFWNDLLFDVLGANKSVDMLQSEKEVKIPTLYKKQKTSNVGASQLPLEGLPQTPKSTSFIDFYLPKTKVLIEHKSRGIDLDKSTKQSDGMVLTPYEQGVRYANSLVAAERPRFIVVSNFDEIRIYDLNNQENLFGTKFVLLKLNELPRNLDLLKFLIVEDVDGIVHQADVSTAAAEKFSRLFAHVKKAYKEFDAPLEDQVLLMMRLLFCLYAEDSGLFRRSREFFEYFKQIDAGVNGSFHLKMRELFTVLNTPFDSRDKFLPQNLQSFPYVNGGLFAKEIVIPFLSNDVKQELLLECSQEFKWDVVSPVIFGSLFESLLSADERREGGMHYTSIENIHKVTKPLFLDELEKRVRDSLTQPHVLEEIHNEIAQLNFIDPACGSGNFLTQTYIDLRKIENVIIQTLYGAKEIGGFEWNRPDEMRKVSLNQFYGIEINSYAVSIAKTALWIAEHQMDVELSRQLGTTIQTLPLKESGNIVQGNALRIDWNDVLPAGKCSYIIGNPPFANAKLTDEMKEDRVNIFERNGGKLDYVACWYIVAARYMKDTEIRAAFVSTNSISQGQQVPILWNSMFDLGIHIDFAYQTFVWDNEAANQAHVYVIIVGFSYANKKSKRLFNKQGEKFIVDNINGYLEAGVYRTVESRRKPLSDVPEMVYGIKPADNGNLLLSEDEKNSIIAKYPEAQNYILPFVAGKDLLDGKTRYCLWLVKATEQEINSIPAIKERVENCRIWRSNQSPTGDAYKLKDTPHLLRPSKKFQINDYLVVPLTTSERRKYVPLAFIQGKTIPANSSAIVPNATIYIFGILISQFHNAWMRVVAGRLESRYRYSSDIVYNNFIWPVPTDAQRAEIETRAQAVLDAREAHAGKSLADLYDPDKMPVDLLETHKQLDRAVEEAYGVNFNGDEEKIVAHLFKLYAEATKGNE